MARPPTSDEESEDERSQTYSDHADLRLNSTKPNIPIVGTGPTFIGMFFKEW